MAFPGGNVLAGLTHKKHFPVFLIRKVGTQYQYTFFLICATEVKEVVVLPEGHRAICISGHDVIGIKNGNGSWLQFFHQPLAVDNKEVFANGFVLHKRIISS